MRIGTWVTHSSFDYPRSPDPRQSIRLSIELKHHIQALLMILHLHLQSLLLQHKNPLIPLLPQSFSPIPIPRKRGQVTSLRSIAKLLASTI
jgi:hypothetical protein